MKSLYFFLVAFFFISSTYAQVDQPYMEPPKEILELVDIQANPSIRLTYDNEYAVFLERTTFKTLEELSEEELGLGGVRVNPETNGPSRTSFYTGLSVQKFMEQQEVPVSGGTDWKITNLSYSPDDSHAAFLNLNGTTFELWLLELASGELKKLAEGINPLMGGPFSWMPDSKSLLVQFIPEGRAAMADNTPLPEGPIVQETSGSKAVVRTYQNLLQNPYDEQLFDHFMTGEWKKVGVDGSMEDFLPAGIYRTMSWSPDGKYLMTAEVKKPYSYIVPWYRFPYDVNIYHADGKKMMTFHECPLTEEIPKGFDATETGKRSISWRNDQPARLVWAEALDEGDPAKEVEFRDEVFQLEAPFDGEPRSLAKTKRRYRFIQWGNDNTAILYEYWWKTRMIGTYLLDPSQGKMKLISERSSQDLYNDPGSFLTKRDPETGEYLLWFSSKQDRLYLEGEGYGPEGNRPFLDVFNLKDFSTKRIWQADGESTYEQIVDVIDPEKAEMITRIEAPTTYPNYYLRKKNKLTQLTESPNPYESFAGVSKETIQYKRSDGVDLSGNLYLPEGYDKDKDGPLPVLMWAYPREYKDAGQAGQVKDSPHEFVYLFYGSPIYWAARGYAVFDRADFPIIGEGDDEPNDSFVEQLVLNAEAAINKLVELGVGDRDRMAIGGHSYGAFMTANLMAHSDLFAAGIARSGAYNRTLTPFGFQSEERTFWDDRELYLGMSPFTHADKINEPLLLIHGDADNNPGTFTLQSERLYGAIKGLGGTSRLVLLPFESHGYAARKNILHMLWEMDTWLETYVKNKE